MLIELIKDIFVSVVSSFISSFFGLDKVAKDMKDKININNFKLVKKKHPILVYSVAGIFGGFLGYIVGVLIGVVIIIISLGGFLFDFNKPVNYIGYGCIILGFILGAYGISGSKIDNDG